MGIGLTLNNLINDSCYNINELAVQVGVNAQTLYSIIKRDNMKADLELLVKICDVLDVDLNVFYKDYSNNKKTSSIQLTPSEQTLLDGFRELNEDGQEYINKQMEFATNKVAYKKHSELNTISKKQA